MLKLRWSKRKRRWRNDDCRIVKRFAIFPISCKEYRDDRIDTETRWLQTVYIIQMLRTAWDEYQWKNRRFVEKAEYEEYLKEEAEFLAEG